MLGGGGGGGCTDIQACLELLCMSLYSWLKYLFHLPQVNSRMNHKTYSNSKCIGVVVCVLYIATICMLGNLLCFLLFADCLDWLQFLKQFFINVSYHIL